MADINKQFQAISENLKSVNDNLLNISNNSNSINHSIGEGIKAYQKDLNRLANSVDTVVGELKGSSKHQKWLLILEVIIVLITAAILATYIYLAIKTKQQVEELIKQTEINGSTLSYVAKSYFREHELQNIFIRLSVYSQRDCGTSSLLQSKVLSYKDFANPLKLNNLIKNSDKLDSYFFQIEKIDLPKFARLMISSNYASESKPVDFNNSTNCDHHSELIKTTLFQDEGNVNEYELYFYLSIDDNAFINEFKNYKKALERR
jgi:hypothetical protein